MNQTRNAENCEFDLLTAHVAVVNNANDANDNDDDANDACDDDDDDHIW